MEENLRTLERAARAGDPGAAKAMNRAAVRADKGLWLEIDGEIWMVESHDDHDHQMAMLEIENLETEEIWEIWVAENEETAGAATRAYWQAMARDDPREFRAIIGDETLVNWALGQPASPGSVPCSSLEEWLDRDAEYPEEHFASYDGEEREIDRASPELVQLLGFTPEVGYRHN